MQLTAIKSQVCEGGPRSAGGPRSSLHPLQAVFSHGAGGDGCLVPARAQGCGKPRGKFNADLVIGLVHHDVVRVHHARRMLGGHEARVELGRALVCLRAAHGLAHELRPMHDLANAPAKAGCAYQPLDPTYPKARLNFMMQDAGAKLLIADTALFPLVDGFQGDVIYTSDLPNLPAGGAAPKAPAPDNLFIMLYTSGSTGVPKGCQLTHANLVAFCHWYQRYYDLQPDHRVAAYASYGFDACMMDMYPALTCGASVHIVPEELRLDLMALNDYFE